MNTPGIVAIVAHDRDRCARLQQALAEAGCRSAVLTHAGEIGRRHTAVFVDIAHWDAAGLAGVPRIAVLAADEDPGTLPPDAYDVVWMDRLDAPTLHLAVRSAVHRHRLQAGPGEQHDQKQHSGQSEQPHLPAVDASAYRRLVMKTGDGVLVLSRQGTIHFANPTAQAMFGRDEMIGRSLGRPIIAGTLTEIDLLQASGRIVTVELRTTATQWEGQPAVLAALRDITPHRRTEQRLRATLRRNEQLITAVRNLSAGVVITDPHLPDNPIVYANPAFLALTGYAYKEVAGRNCRFLQGSETDPAAVARLREAIRTQRIFRGTLLNYRKDGTTFWNQLTVSPVYDEHGGLASYIGLQADITQQMEDQQLIRLQASLMDHAQEAMIISSANGVITYCNESTEQLFQLRREQILGQRVQHLHDALRSGGPPAAEIIQVLQNQDHWSGEIDFQVGGEVRSFHNSVSVVRNASGQPEHAIAVLRDVTERRRQSRELQQSEQRFRKIFNVAPVPVVLSRRANRVIIDANHRLTEVLGYSLDQLIGRCLDDFLVAPLSPVQPSPADEKAGQAHQMEVQAVRADGSIATLLISEQAFQMNGESILVTGLLDITARKAAEEQLRYQAYLVDNVSDAVIAVDVDARVRLWNPAAERIYGWSAAEALGRPVSKMVGSQMTQVERSAAYEKLFQDGIWEGQVIQYSREGRELHILSAVQFLRDAQGRLDGYVAVNRDITQIEKTRRELERSQAYSDRIISSLSDGFAVSTVEGVQVDVNDALCTMTGFTREELLGCTPPYPYWSEEDRPQIEAAFRQTLAGQFQEFELLFQRKDGTPLPVLVSPSGLRDAEGAFVLLFATVKDITERKNMENALRHQRYLAEALRETAVAMSSKLSTDAVLDMICLHARRVVPGDVTSVSLIEGGTVRVIRALASQHTRLADELKGMCARLSTHHDLMQVVMSHEPLIVPRPDTPISPAGETQLSWLCSTIHAPIVIDEAVIGFLTVSSHQPDCYGDQQRRDLQTFADQASIAMRNARLYQQVTSSQQRMQRLSQQIISVQEEERKRLSRELHDEAGQALTALKIHLELLHDELLYVAAYQASHAGQLADIIAAVDQTSEQIRSISHRLRPPALDTVTLDEALEGLCQEFTRRTSIPVRYTGMDVPDVRETAKISLYRVLQEALTNVAKHARASVVRVRLSYDAETISLVVQDNGQGLRDDPAGDLALQPGVGLLGMRERMETLGGLLEVASPAAGGVILTASLPWE